ncbi:GGDEF domain-containing protein [uncultured Marinobacter sp.]|uniref:GGDEF domain-containing protein n=1 Tax=uncultured Marinobacter sp. TaxID=187379 RepID=UPI0030DC351A
MAAASSGPGFQSISRRILRQVTAVALLSMVVLGSLQAWLTYRNELARFEELVVALSETHVPLLTVSLWDIEPRAVELQVAQMSAYPEFARVSVYSMTGMHFVDRAPGHYGDNPDKVVSIPHPADPEQYLGELAISFDRSYLNRSMVGAVTMTLLQYGVFTALIILLLHRIIRRHLQEPLRAIADYSTQLRPERDNPPLVIPRQDRRHQDEIDLVTEGFDTLRDAIARFGRERDHAIQALQEERDSLDDRVRERTGYVQRVNDFLQLLSRLSADLIDLPAGSHRTAMESALEDLAHRVNAQRCGLASWSRQGPWNWVYLWTAPGAGTRGLPVPLPEPEDAGWSVGASGLPDNTLACVLTVADRKTTALVFEGDEMAQLEPLDQRLLQLAAEVLFKMMDRWEHLEELEASRRELFRLSRTDHLTGLANRRYFEEACLIEGRRAQRTGVPVSMLMLDVDFFKSFNDRYGHALGDECLIQLAKILGHCCRRAGELPARLGGEEFAVLLPEHDTDSALVVAEQTRGAIEDLNLTHKDSPEGRVTVSIGVATWQPAAEPPESFEQIFAEILAEADDRLYDAKRAGRNRVHPIAHRTVRDIRS